MPSRPTSVPPAAAKPRANFRQQYDDMEARRVALLARLRGLRPNAEGHPGYSGALKLLNEKFRKAKLAQRLAVLEAAAWMIEVLERLTAGL